VAEREERVPLVEERLRVGTRVSETGRVRVRLSTEEIPERIRGDVWREAVEVARVPVDREVQEAPDIRTDGDLTIIPVLEERLVVERRLFLVEEIHLRRAVSVDEVEGTVLLRRQRADVERSEKGGTQREE
jgi:stress response protein YsnF